MHFGNPSPWSSTWHHLDTRKFSNFNHNHNVDVDLDIIDDLEVYVEEDNNNNVDAKKEKFNNMDVLCV